MADRKHLLHVKSNVAETAKQYGIEDFLVTPKKPVDSTTGKATDDTLLYGEIAVNYGKGVESLTIRNTEDDVVAFVNENDFYEAGEIAADGLATEKMERMEAFNSLKESSLTKMISVTYSELKSLKNSSQLKAGQFYRITDYVTTTTQENTNSAGHAFDVIVLATDVDTLNENAKAIKHEGDTYFADCNLDAWEIKYDLDNDRSKYAWADETNGKGVIFYMKDEWNNECPYDFKNIQFKRWAVTDVQNEKLDSDSETVVSFKETFVFDNDNTKFITRYAYKNTNYKNGDTTYYVNGNDSDWYYTFSTFIFKDGIYYINRIEDASTKGNNFYNGDYGGGCYGNSIKPSYNRTETIYHDIEGAQYLNNIVFNGFYETFTEGYFYQHCFANSIDYNTDDITFGNYCYVNTFGNDCGGNTFGNSCIENRFEAGCHSNTFGTGCNGIIFGNYCGGNTFGNDCSGNTFGHGCTNNTYGVRCHNNSIGNECDNNSFGNECDNNSFRKGCNDITFGNYCSGNTFGDECIGNTFGNDCSGNTFGHGCTNNTFEAGCFSNTFEVSCFSNTFEVSCSSNTFGNECGGNTFGRECKGNTFGKICSKNSFRNNCVGNTFGNRCDNNSFMKDYMYYNIVEEGNTYITVTSLTTTSLALKLRNFTIAQGVNNVTGEDGRKMISHQTTNDTFKTTYQNANSKTVDI